MAFPEFAHILWEASKPSIVLTDRKCVKLFSKRRHFCQHCGMHAIMCCTSFPELHTLPVQSTLQLILSPDWNSKSRRRYVSNPGRYPNNTYRSGHTFIGCRRRRTIFLHTSRQNRLVRSTLLRTDSTTQAKWEAMGSK